MKKLALVTVFTSAACVNTIFFSPLAVSQENMHSDRPQILASLDSAIDAGNTFHKHAEDDHHSRHAVELKSEQAQLDALNKVIPLSDPTMAKVLVTLHPLALIAASVVSLDQLEVLMPPGASPHDFALRPSDIDRIQEADVVFWVGPQAEPYLAGFAQRWPEKRWITLSDFANADQPQDDHYWLSAQIAIKAQQMLAKTLGKDSAFFAADVKDALTYSHVALAPVKNVGFFVYHRAYDHWVYEQGLNQQGYFTMSSERKTGMRTLTEMRAQLLAGNIACVFVGKGVDLGLVEKLTEGANVRQQVLDPLANGISISEHAYGDYLRKLADDALKCLKTPSVSTGTQPTL
ncbi:MAG: zinc ABC transporter substrate-binding protein [Oleibacter sp.]|nr:zinc ABC transporter substrate-binding protein [Thalassolituus sp.]